MASNGKHSSDYNLTSRKDGRLLRKPSLSCRTRQRKHRQEDTRRTSARPRSYREPRTWSICRTHPRYLDFWILGAFMNTHDETALAIHLHATVTVISHLGKVYTKNRTFQKFSANRPANMPDLLQ